MHWKHIYASNTQKYKLYYEKAKAETPGATDLFPYTHLINENLDHEDKCAILTAMWRVAFADGNIDKYEELLIRRVQIYCGWIIPTSLLLNRLPARPKPRF